MLPHMFAVLQQFPFSEQRPGVTYASVQPVSWNEASVLERRFSPGITPEEAVVVAADLIHDDYAYVFDAYWDLWTPDETWTPVVADPEPGQVHCARGRIRRGAHTTRPDTSKSTSASTRFSCRRMSNSPKRLRPRFATTSRSWSSSRRKRRVNTRATSRRLWSESEESLPQKLIARLQKVQ